MYIKREIIRPDWKKISNKNIDLSKNVHHDRILNEKIKSIISNSDFLINYANDINLYNAICEYYKIKIENVAIGFGATDLIYRVLNSIDIEHLYIVNPSFMMVDVYCKMINLNYEFVDLNQLDDLKIKKNSGVYFVNQMG